MSDAHTIACATCDVALDVEHFMFGAQVHHIREGQGMAQRASDYLTIPLCDRHHSNASPDGIHGQRKAWKLAQVDEIDGLADTLENLL